MKKVFFSIFILCLVHLTAIEPLYLDTYTIRSIDIEEDQDDLSRFYLRQFIDFEVGQTYEYKKLLRAIKRQESQAYLQTGFRMHIDPHFNANNTVDLYIIADKSKTKLAISHLGFSFGLVNVFQLDGFLGLRVGTSMTGKPEALAGLFLPHIGGSVFGMDIFGRATTLDLLSNLIQEAWPINVYFYGAYKLYINPTPAITIALNSRFDVFLFLDSRNALELNATGDVFGVILEPFIEFNYLYLLEQMGYGFRLELSAEIPLDLVGTFNYDFGANFEGQFNWAIVKDVLEFQVSALATMLNSNNALGTALNSKLLWMSQAAASFLAFASVKLPVTIFGDEDVINYVNFGLVPAFNLGLLADPINGLFSPDLQFTLQGGPFLEIVLPQISSTRFSILLGLNLMTVKPIATLLIERRYKK